MKFSLIAIAAAAAIFGQASPVPEPVPQFVPPPGGGPCPTGKKVFGFARFEGMNVRGEDFTEAEYAQARAEGKYDNFGGPVLAGALIRSNSLPGQTLAFVQSRNSNYFYHKKSGNPFLFAFKDPGYDLYYAGSCSEFVSNADTYGRCCE